MKNLDEYNSIELLALYKLRMQNEWNFYEYKINQIDGYLIEEELVTRLLAYDNKLQENE